jgi:hypothetical protein
MSETMQTERPAGIGAYTGNRAQAASERPPPDFYETHGFLVRALLASERPPGPIWEPCAGRGAISRELLSAGLSVVSTDLYAYDGADVPIETGVDFLTCDAAGYPRAIVMNPPFNAAAEFLERACAVADYVAALLPLNFVCRKTTPTLDRLAVVYALSPRPPRLHRVGWTGRESGATMNLCWVVFDRHNRSNSALFQRMSWQEHETHEEYLARRERERKAQKREATE